MRKVVSQNLLLRLQISAFYDALELAIVDSFRFDSDVNTTVGSAHLPSLNYHYLLRDWCFFFFLLFFMCNEDQLRLMFCSLPWIQNLASRDPFRRGSTVFASQAIIAFKSQSQRGTSSQQYFLIMHCHLILNFESVDWIRDGILHSVEKVPLFVPYVKMMA